MPSPAASASMITRKQRQVVKFATAVQMHQAGRLPEAEALYRKVIAASPRDVAAMTNLGLIAFQSKRLDEAARLFRQAVGIMPNYVDAHVNLGAAYFELGRLQEAADSLRKALTLHPANTLAHTTLGQILRSQQRPDDAIAHFRLALVHAPKSISAAFQLSVTLTKFGQPSAAIPVLTHLLQQSPDLPEAWNELGLAYDQLGQPEAASAHYTRALVLQPLYCVAHYNLGGILQRQGKLIQAAACCREALRLQPNLLFAHIRLGQISFALGQLAQAAASFTHALQLTPEEPDALHGLGNVLQHLGRHDDAIDAYSRAIASQPGNAITWLNLGQALQTRVRLDEAIACFMEAVRLEPDHATGWLYLTSAKMYAADWTDLDHCERKVLDSIHFDLSKSNPFIFLMVNSSASEQLLAAQKWVNSNLAAVVPLPRQPRHAGDRIRVGYLSTDFRQHATAFLTTGMFESHDRSRFEIIAYSIGPNDGSEDRQRLHAAFDSFTDINTMSHEQAAQRIQADQIDILVDLKGHTGGSRTEIMAYRPAPIQVNYLGYPGTMGADFIDYIMVDRVIVPPTMAPFFSEQLVHLPHSYQPNMHRPIALTPDTRTDHGLPETGFAFACFNQAYKITPPVFDIWMRLLHNVPSAVLWLLNWNRFATENLQRQAVVRGIDPSRLIFGPILAATGHLGRMRHVDLYLDTLPVCAHTMASDALWGGAPLISCMGPTFVSRVSASLLMSIGMDDLVTETLAGYEALALRLAQDKAELAAVRQRLWNARLTTPLFDTALTIRHVEAAFSEMWQRHCRGLAPEAFAVTPLA